MLPERVTDDDVRRIADERRAPANVTKDGGADEQRSGIDVERLAQREHHGREEQHGGDIVQKRAQHGVENHQHDKETPHGTAGELDDAYAEVLKHTSAAEKGDDDHHAKEERERAVVHPGENRRHGGKTMLQRENEEHGRGTEKGDEGAMDDFSNDESENGNQEHESEPDAGVSDDARVHRRDGERDGLGAVSAKAHENIAATGVVRL